MYGPLSSVYNLVFYIVFLFSFFFLFPFLFPNTYYFSSYLMACPMHVSGEIVGKPRTCCLKILFGFCISLGACIHRRVCSLVDLVYVCLRYLLFFLWFMFYLFFLFIRLRAFLDICLCLIFNVFFSLFRFSSFP